MNEINLKHLLYTQNGLALGYNIRTYPIRLCYSQSTHTTLSKWKYYRRRYALGIVSLNLSYDYRYLTKWKYDRGYEAYDRLSPSFAKYLETLEAVHEARFFRLIADGAHIKLRDGQFIHLKYDDFRNY